MTDEMPEAIYHGTTKYVRADILAKLRAELEDGGEWRTKLVEALGKLLAAQEVNAQLRDALDVAKDQRLAAENIALGRRAYQKEIAGLVSLKHEQASIIAELKRVRELNHDELCAAQDALHAISGWARAYPVEVFPAPSAAQYAAAHEALKGIVTLDALHAAWARHILDGIARIVRDGLAALDDVPPPTQGST